MVMLRLKATSFEKYMSIGYLDKKQTTKGTRDTYK